MKIKNIMSASGLGLLVMLSPVSPVVAQTVTDVIVEKSILNAQTSASTVTAVSGNYDFNVTVTGNNLSAITTPTWSGPITNVGTWYNGGNLVYSAGTDSNGQTYEQWGTGPDGLTAWSSPTLADLNAHFADGTYTVNVNGHAIPLVLSGGAFPNAPLLTLTGGTWSNGEYLINPSQSLTITTSAFTAYGTHPDDLIQLSVDGITKVTQFHSQVPGSNTVTYTIPGGTYQPGQSIYLDAYYAAGVNLNPGALAGSLNAAVYSQGTYAQVQYAPIPVPASAWLLLSGLIGLGLIKREITGNEKVTG